MPEIPKSTVEMLKLMGKADTPFNELNRYVQAGEPVPEHLKQFLQGLVDASTPRPLNTFIRNHCIYWEYQIEEAKPKGQRLPLRKGEGGWHEDIGKRYHLSDSGIETIVTKMRKINES